MKTVTRRSVFLGSALALLCPLPLYAQQGGPSRNARKPTYPIFDAAPASHSLSRFDLEIDGRGYRIFLAIPTADAPASGWPSVWMLDGNSVFDRLSPALLAKHPSLAVVAVGYPVDMTIDSQSRSLDYTPVRLNADAPDAPARETSRPSGGADAFRARLTGPIREAVVQRAPLDPIRRTLWGHSYGGLFTLHCLLSEPDSFAAWAPTSASIGFGGGAVPAMIANAPKGARTAPVLMMLGDSEHRRGTEAPTEPRPNPMAFDFAKSLEGREDLLVSVTVFEGLGHGQTFVQSFTPTFLMAESLPPR